MYKLYDLIALLAFDPKEIRGPKLNSKILLSSWQENGDKNFLALWMSTNYILLRYGNADQSPVIRQVPWIHGCPIRAMTFDQTGHWLLIVCNGVNSTTMSLYILPVLALMDVDRGKKVMEPLFDINDVTIIPISEKGKPTSISWWRTFNGAHIAIIGTKGGSILFVNLIKRTLVYKTEIKGSISSIRIVQDNSQLMSHALITGFSKNRWKLALEKMDMSLGRIRRDDEHHQIASEDLSVASILHDQSLSDDFVPLRPYQKFPISVYLRPQYAKGRYFLTAFEKARNLFYVYDSSFEHDQPLFVYHVPKETEDVLLMDRLLCCVVLNPNGTSKLCFISQRQAEVSPDNSSEGISSDSILQQFRLPKHTIIDFNRRTFPYNMFDSDKSAPNHTVLDGCLIVTEENVFECRPRISPESLFLETYRSLSMARAEDMGIKVGLDIHGLYEVVGDEKLKSGDFSGALKIYQQSKCTPSKLAAKYVEKGYIKEIIGYLQRVLSYKSISCNSTQNKHLANFFIYCYVYMLQSGEVDQSLKQVFREFLINNVVYDEDIAIALLTSQNLMEELVLLAKVRGLLPEMLENMAARGFLHLNKNQMDILLHLGLAPSLINIANGSFLKCFTPKELLSVCSSRPTLALSLVDIISIYIQEYSEADLLLLAIIYDPSRPVMQGLLQKAEMQLLKSSRFGSMTSLSSLAAVTVDAEDSSVEKGKKLVNFFLKIIIELNHQRLIKPSHRDSSCLSPIQSISEMPSIIEKVKPNILSTGASHCAYIYSGYLFTWGRSNKGRLGRPYEPKQNEITPPGCVNVFQHLGIKVVSISCGNEHCLAITQHGVYSWGSSKYGQLGHGDNLAHISPMLIEALLSRAVISVKCGQYHSLALTAEGSMCSWGWGVHGQLGHGVIDDISKPKRIIGLKGLHISQIEAGYAHSLALTDTGEVWVFGCNVFGQIGYGQYRKLKRPHKLDGIPHPVSFISTDYFSSFAVTDDGELWCWGVSPSMIKHIVPPGKERKDGHHEYLVPRKINTDSVRGNIIQIASGIDHFILLNDRGQIFSWGKNIEGQLGTGDTKTHFRPVYLSTVNDIIHVSCGDHHTIAVNQNMDLIVWGKNDSGQLIINDDSYGDVMLSQYCGPIYNPIKVDSASVFSTDDLKNDDKNWVTSPSPAPDSMPPLGEIPQLSEMTVPQYGIELVEFITQQYGKFCDIGKLIQYCLSRSLLKITSKLYEQENDIPMALHHLLKHFKAKNEVYQNEVEENVFRLLNAFPGISYEAMADLSSIQAVLTKVFQFWYEYNFAGDALQDLLLRKENLTVPLCCCLLSMSEKPKSILTKKFQLSVTAKIMQLISGDDLKHDARKMVYNLLGYEVVLKANSQKQDMLWKGVLDQLQQGFKDRKDMVISLTEVRSFLGDDKGRNVQVFTCGHNFSHEDFVLNVLPQMMSNLSYKCQPASILEKCYRADGFVPLACPKCVVLN